MSQKFLMLFLVSPSKTISLGVAAKVLNGFQKNDGGTQIKTQIRRLYDIANVLSSIGLIQKKVLIAQNGRKPAFKYIGPLLQSDTDIFTTGNCVPKNTPKKLIIEKSRKKSLTRHSSFQEICAIAEIEHRKLNLEETPKSAPPFQRSLNAENQTPAVTNFSHFNFSANIEVENLSAKNIKKQKDNHQTKEYGIYVNQNESSTDEKSETEIPVKPLLIPVQSNMRMINVPKEVFSPESSTYLILNPLRYECLKSSKQIGTFLLYSPGPFTKSILDGTQDKISNIEVVTSQSIALSKQESSLKSLSQSLCPEKNAAMQLECSTSKSVPLNNNFQIGALKSAEFIESPAWKCHMNFIKPPNKDILASDIESNDSLSICSTRNSSPISNASRFDSPLSIPSGYATPVPSNISSDVSFPSCNETCSILKNIECSSNESFSKSEVPFRNSATGNMFDIENLANYRMQEGKNTLSLDVTLTPDAKNKTLSGDNSSYPLKNIQNLSILNNSFSNDSLNSEVSEILKGKKLGELNTKRNFLIDEKTILSPIKKHKKEGMHSKFTPSPSITPRTVPENYFVFNSSRYHSRALNNALLTSPLIINSCIKDDEPKDNASTS